MSFAGDSGQLPDMHGLFGQFSTMQKAVADRISAIGANPSGATPSAFLLVQFEMSKTTQVGEGISNLISAIQGINMNSIRNFKQ